MMTMTTMIATAPLPRPPFSLSAAIAVADGAVVGLDVVGAVVGLDIVGDAEGVGAVDGAVDGLDVVGAAEGATEETTGLAVAVVGAPFTVKFAATAPGSTVMAADSVPVRPISISRSPGARRRDGAQLPEM